MYKNICIDMTIILVVFFTIFFIPTVSLHGFLDSETTRIVRTNNPDSTYLEKVSKTVEEEWNIDSGYSIKYKIEKLVEMLTEEGLDDLLLFENKLLTWTKLLRNTVLKEQTGPWSDLGQQLQQKVDLLIQIMETDNFKNILDEISDDRIVDLLIYFVNDAQIYNFHELQLSSYDIEQLIETLKEGLEFRGWLPLWLTVEPGLWVKYSIEMERNEQAAENFRQYLLRKLELDGITWVDFNYRRTKMSLDRLKPSHPVNIYEGEGSASFQARKNEIKKGIMIPFEVVRYMRGGNIYIADGHSRAYAAYELGLEEIEVFYFTPSEDLPDMESRVAPTVLDSVSDIPTQRALQEEAQGVRVFWHEFLDMAPRQLIKQVWLENKEQGNPTLIGVSGFFLSGRNTIVKELIERCTFTDELKILSLDNYYLTEDKKPVETIMDLPEIGEEVKIPYTEITISQTIGIREEPRVVVKTIFGMEDIRVPEVGVEVKLENYHISIATLEEGKILIRIPEFLARYELGRYFKDIRRLKQGKPVFVPVCRNRPARDRLYVSEEEIDTLQQQGAEQIIEDDLRLIRHPGLTGSLLEKYGDDIWINMDTGEVVWRLIPDTNIVFVTGPHALHRPEINALYDWRLFTDALRHIRRDRAVTNHILLGYDSDFTVPEVIQRFEESREREDDFEIEQRKYAHYIIDTNRPFSLEEWEENYLPLKEAVDRGIEVAIQEEVNEYEALKYIRYCINPRHPLWNALDIIIESRLSSSKLKDFIRQRQYILREDTDLLVDVLITFNLLPSTFRI